MKPTIDLLNEPVQPVLVRMTLPMMFGIVSLMLFNLADAWFIGQLGTDQLAALAFTFPICFSLTSLAIGLGVGTSATLARLLGTGEEDKVARLATDNLLMAIILTAVVGLIGQVTVVPLVKLMGATPDQIPYVEDYMGVWFFAAIFMVLNLVCNSTFRAYGDTRFPALIMFFSSLLNLILDPLLIFGLGPFPEMGMRGAAIASLIAWFLASVYAVWMLGRVKGLIILGWLEWPTLISNWISVLKISLPAAFSNIMTPVANGILTAIVAAHGAAAVAAFGVGARIESLALLACLALSMTLPPFISQNFGAHQWERVQSAYRSSIQFALVWQLVIYLALALLAGFITQLFTDDSEVALWLTLWILIVPLGFGFQATSFLSASAFNALHQPFRAMRISLIRLFVLYVPFGWVGSYFFELKGMFVALVLANAVTALLAWFWMVRFQTRMAAQAT